MNTIQRIRSADNFTIIPNIVFNSGLSLRAVGLLTFILQLPDDWKLYKNYVYDVMSRDGKDAINSAWRQLEETGFIIKKVIPKCGKNGLPEIQYFIFDTPQKVAENPQQLPKAGFPLPETRQPETRQRKMAPLLSTKEPSIKEVLPNGNTAAKSKKPLKNPIPKQAAPPISPRPPKKEKDELWQRWVTAWFEFFKPLNEGREPNFNGAQAKALKEIRKYLAKVSKPRREDPPDQPPEENGFNAWVYLLTHWDRLEEWQQKQFDLTMILKKLPEFLNQLKSQKNGSHKQTLNGKLGVSEARTEALSTWTIGGGK